MGRRTIAISALVVTLVLIAGGLFVWANSQTPPDPEGFPRPTNTPTDFNADVRITSPRDGAILYAEAVTVRGVSSAPSRFRVEVVVDDAILVSGIVEAQAGDWAIELRHAYDGDPIEAIIRAVPIRAEGEYQSVLVALSRITERPQGAFGRVDAPIMGADIGGDFIVVEGRASGIPNNVLTIRLADDGGLTIDERIVLLDNPYYVDDMPFHLEVATRDYTGSATLTITFGPSDAADTLSELIAVTIVGAAG